MDNFMFCWYYLKAVFWLSPIGKWIDRKYLTQPVITDSN